MLPPTLAASLTDAGCDTVSVSADADLRGASDADVLAFASAKGRVLVTENIRDFVPLSNAWTAQGRTHAGILLISSKRFPMNRGRSGGIATALLQRHAQGDWPAPAHYEWLS